MSRQILTVRLRTQPVKGWFNGLSHALTSCWDSPRPAGRKRNQGIIAATALAAAILPFSNDPIGAYSAQEYLRTTRPVSGGWRYCLTARSYFNYTYCSPCCKRRRPIAASPTRPMTAKPTADGSGTEEIGRPDEALGIRRNPR